MTNPNSNRPILSLKPKVVIPESDQVVELMLNSMVRDGTSFMSVSVDDNGELNISTIPKEKTLKRITNAGTIRKLKKLFPLAFFGSKESKLPLAYGIHKQLLSAETGFSRKRIRKAIYWYTSRPSYHKGVIDSENRINLDGSIASVVTDEDKAYAAGRIAVIEEAKALRDANIQPIDLLG